jgi:capsular exopolysaccharide synthesis family protein
MSFDELTKLLRKRWLTVTAATLAGILGAIASILLTTPLYAATTRLFLSTSVGDSAVELYQGNRLSQERVLSYTELLKGRTLAQRTIDRLDLSMGTAELQAKIKAGAKLDTVLINVEVRDASPVRARDIANALSDEFVLMVRELETPKPGAQPDARVVVEQRAMVPNSPVVPRKSFNLAVGLVLGLTVGISLALMRHYLDNTVQGPQLLEEITGAGVVGTIPLDKDRRNTPAISFESDRSAAAEAFRKFRTNLQFISVDQPPRLIVITSSVPTEGKSTTSINIALALAEAGHNVVLVDGDMRKPSLDKYLGLVGSVGLSTVLSGMAGLSDVLQETKYPNLTVLTAGSIPPNPSELLSSRAASRVLEDLRQRFDYVIIDTSPLLAVTDAAVLATNSDGVLVICRFGRTKREQLGHAVASLRSVGATILGSVLTLAPTRRGSSYAYDYYYYGYGERPETEKQETQIEPDSAKPPDEARQ